MFDQFLAKITGRPDASRSQPWQSELAAPASCGNRLIRIPTGFGKTLGVLSAWAWHRVRKQNEGWPRRLVWCLPMRVLVEQTESEVRSALERLGLLWNGEDAHEGKVGVHLIMGGADAGQWHLHPESDAVLIGTQDMLLSRAMNRGYASPRARWPMEFGLLNQDALWVMDEVQLMDVGLATSGQLQVFREEDQSAGKTLRPCFTWWMSATLQRCWLEKSPDTASLTKDLAQNTLQIEPEDRSGKLWDGVTKPMKVVPFPNPKELAWDASERHRERGCGKEGPTLIVLNTVKNAVEVWNTLKSDKKLGAAGTDIRLVHSRFRPSERKPWSGEFLNRAACAPGTNRIIVATQVIEAGVDVSASLLVTELAPWTSLVQRFGRCARWGGRGQVVVADFKHDSDGEAAPYLLDELESACNACDALPDVAPIHLECFEEQHESLLPRLYPYEPKHLLLRHELDDLFDTSPDLSGADIDISRFIRSGNERDVQVFWAEVNSDGPSPNIKPTRDELCRVPFLEARNWLCKRKSESLKSDVRAWVWDWLGRRWRDAARRDLHPGQTVLVDCRVGGYRDGRGWDPDSKEPVTLVELDVATRYESRECWTRDRDGWRPGTRCVRSFQPEDHADAAEEDESLSVVNGWQTIATHGLLVGEEVKRIAAAVAPDMMDILHLAGRWHDLGKAHPAFQNSIQSDDRPERDDIAKAPDIAWPCSTRNMYRISSDDQRRGFRHELASVLGLFGVLQRHQPRHDALIGPWRDWFDAIGDMNTPTRPANGAETAQPTAIEREVLDLNADEFDLLAYLVCAHHGKVRMAWHASPADQEANGQGLRIRGVREGDILPPVLLAGLDGECHHLPATALDLSPSEAGLSSRTGRSWSERVLNLVERLGPFTLAWLETLLRTADQRASDSSKQKIADKFLQTQENENVRQSLDRSDRTLAQPAGGGAQAPASGGDSPSSSQFHGHGGRASGRGLDSGTTRPPHSATRYVETSVGILSYKDLAPLLAERVANTDLAISNQMFADTPIHVLLLELHRRICGDLTPGMAGRWRLRDVRVGEHQAPPHWKVPMLMHDYAADLEVRISNLDATPSERLIADLVFAEGRFLYIHPFDDFNGRVSRLFLTELLYRLNLSVIDPAASSPEEAKRYFAALQAYDRHDPRPLSAIWQHRFSRGRLR